MTYGAREQRRAERDDAPRPRTPAAAPAPQQAILALQRGAGNAAVSALLARYTTGQTGGTPPPPGFAKAASANSWLADAPMRAVNSLLNLRREEANFTDLTFLTIESLVPGAPEPGVIDDTLLEQLLKRAVDRGQQSEFAHVIEARIYGGARVEASLRFDAALRAPSAVVSEGSARVITLGPPAFADLATLEKTLGGALSAILGSTGKQAPALLSGEALKAAILNNSRQPLDLVTAAIVSDAIGGDNNDPASEGFAQWLAEFQARRKLPGNGQLNDPTMSEIVEQLRAKGHFNALLRLMVDYAGQGSNVVIDARYDPGLTDASRINHRPDDPLHGPTKHDALTIDFGPKAFAGGFAALYHAVADAFKQAHARHDGLSEGEQRLLGKAQHLLSGFQGGPRESPAGLREDVLEFIELWKAMRPAGESEPDPRLKYLKLLDDVVRGTEERFKALGQLDAPELRRLRFIQKAMQP